MRYLNFLFIFLLISSTLIAQDNVGIGTTNPLEKLHIQGNLRVEGRTIYLGAGQRIYGDNASAYYLDGNHPTVTQLIFRDSTYTNYGKILGAGDGIYFGIADGDGNWGYLQKKDDYTQFRIDDDPKMIIRSNGHVGVGTSSPGGKLTVTVDSAARGFEVLSGNGYTHIPWTNGWSYLAGEGIVFRTTAANTERVRIMPNGFTGFGTAAPAQQIHAVGNIRADGRTLFLGPNQSIYGDNSSAFYVDGNHPTVSQIIMRDQANNIHGKVLGAGEGQYFGLTDGDGNWGYLQSKDDYTVFRINDENKMIIRSSGNVGIGTNSPNSKLSVNGNVRSKEILVETANWPDYVFDEAYELPSLDEEEDFIQENGHLFGFESEEDMDGTITVGDVTKRQQEKIEQMMLHLIEMKKGMKAMESGMEVMEDGMKKMESEISTLKSENKALKEELGKE